MTDIQAVAKKVLDKYSHYGLSKEITLDKLLGRTVQACSTVATTKKQFFGCLNDSQVLTRKKIAGIMDEFRGKPTNEENLQRLKDRLNEICIKGTNNCLGELNEELIKACSNLPTMDEVLECVEEGASYAQLANMDVK